MDQSSDLKLYRLLFTVAGTTYLLWWFAVEWALPGTFNPLASRLAVVACFFVPLALTYRSTWVRTRSRALFIAGVYALTIHYFYLFYFNGGDMNWIIGSFITVTAINLCLLSNAALMAYTVFVLAISVAMVFLLPALQHSVFLPGVITLMAQANIGLRSRLGLIKTLAASNERFRLLFNSTFEGVLVHEAGKIVDANEALARMSGYSRSELLGMQVFDILAPEDRGAVAAKMQLAEVPPYETKGLRKDGALIDVEVRGKEFQLENRLARLVTVQEIGDRKKAELDRVAALTLAENVRVRDEFISLASHELRTPITSLKLQTQLMEREYQRDPNVAFQGERLGRIVDVFGRQINRLIELVDTMLDVSRISSGRLVLESGEVDLGELVRDVCKSLASPLIHVEVEGTVKVTGDSSRIKQVIENLMTNALKYGESRPVHVAVRREGESAMVTVQDDGLGIAPEFVGKIFDRFERAVSKRNISGLGLGLFIARQIVEAHGGEISVKSRLGVGSEFTVSLPAFV